MRGRPVRLGRVQDLLEIRREAHIETISGRVFLEGPSEAGAVA